MKSQQSKKVFGIGIEVELVGHAAANGFIDLNDYIRYLEDTIAKKQSQVEALQAELLKANAANADKAQPL